VSGPSSCSGFAGWVRRGILIEEVSIQMAAELQDELTAFHQFVGEQLDNGGTKPSPEECLEMWRALHPSREELEDSVAAVNRALGQADRGEGKPLEQFDRDFRKKHGIAQDA
jgi:hypothetical protein